MIEKVCNRAVPRKGAAKSQLTKTVSAVTKDIGMISGSSGAIMTLNKAKIADYSGSMPTNHPISQALRRRGRCRRSSIKLPAKNDTDLLKRMDGLGRTWHLEN